MKSSLPLGWEWAPSTMVFTHSTRLSNKVLDPASFLRRWVAVPNMTFGSHPCSWPIPKLERQFDFWSLCFGFRFLVVLGSALNRSCPTATACKTGMLSSVFCDAAFEAWGQNLVEIFVCWARPETFFLNNHKCLDRLERCGSWNLMNLFSLNLVTYDRLFLICQDRDEDGIVWSSPIIPFDVRPRPRASDRKSWTDVMWSVNLAVCVSVKPHTPTENEHGTWKMMVSKRNLLFQGAIFRFHVELWEGA